MSHTIPTRRTTRSSVHTPKNLIVSDLWTDLREARKTERARRSRSRSQPKKNNCKGKKDQEKKNLVDFNCPVTASKLSWLAVSLTPFVTNISEVSQTSSTIDSDYSFLRSTLRSTNIQNRKNAKKKKASSVAKPVRPVKPANNHRLVIALWLGLSAFSVLVLRLFHSEIHWT